MKNSEKLTDFNSLYKARACSLIAKMLDFAVHELHQDPSAFFDLFMSTGMAELYELRDIHTIAGMSGIELAYRVMELSGLDPDRGGYRYTAGRSKEYWAGHAAATYQWDRKVSFSSILNAMELREIIALCGGYRDQEIRELSAGLDWTQTLTVPDHMNDVHYAEFTSRLDEAFAAGSGDTALKRIRLSCGLSQSSLASASGVPLRTIQQYEQRRKDINKAGFDSILKLAAALNCDPSHLVEPQNL